VVHSRTECGDFSGCRLAALLGNHSSQATGITAYRESDGTRERTAIANHASTRNSTIAGATTLA
jgi:hypothetical protein